MIRRLGKGEITIGRFVVPFESSCPVCIEDTRHVLSTTFIDLLKRKREEQIRGTGRKQKRTVSEKIMDPSKVIKSKSRNQSSSRFCTRGLR